MAPEERRKFEQFYRENWKKNKWYINKKNRMALKDKSKFRSGIGRLPGTTKINFSLTVKQIGYARWRNFDHQQKLDEKKRYKHNYDNKLYYVDHNGFIKIWSDHDAQYDQNKRNSNPNSNYNHRNYRYDARTSTR